MPCQWDAMRNLVCQPEPEGRLVKRFRTAIILRLRRQTTFVLRDTGWRRLRVTHLNTLNPGPKTLAQPCPAPNLNESGV